MTNKNRKNSVLAKSFKSSMRRFKSVLIMGNWDIVRMSDTVINAS
jgi:hypothetical protein